MVLAFTNDVVLSFLTFGVLAGILSHTPLPLQSPPCTGAHIAVDALRRLLPRLFVFNGCRPFDGATLYGTSLQGALSRKLEGGGGRKAGIEVAHYYGVILRQAAEGGGRAS